MDKPRVTPKDFFLWAGAMVAFYWSVIAFVLLMFNYMDYSFPNPFSYLSANPYDSGIGSQMASIIVMFPIFWALTWLIRRDIKHDSSRKDIWVRRWALILTLFVAGATMAGDLIVLLGIFFAGNVLTMGFLLKSALLLLVAAAVFMHFIADYWGYWQKNVARERSVSYAVAGLLVLTIIAGFVMYGTPNQARAYRYDAQRVSDLQEIQSRIVNYWQSKEKLPRTLADLEDPVAGFTVPTDPETGAAYSYAPEEYKSSMQNAFQLCATFDTSSDQYASAVRAKPVGTYGYGGGMNDNWQHAAGKQCFERGIDPQLYPPLNAKPAH